MARNNETFGQVSTPSAGGSGAATTVFGGTINPVAQQRLNQRRLGAQLRDPGESGLLGQEPYDPNQIIIGDDWPGEPLDAPQPETPEMARASALRQAAFRTGAELSLLSGLETARAETFGSARLDDSEAASLFRQRASLLTREAIDGMSRAFGSPEDGLEMPTRAVLEDIVEGVASEGARARARALEEKALDVLEAGADDLLAQIRRAPDLADGYAAQMEAMTARYEGGIDADALAAFRANMATEMAEARVLGLAQAGRIADANRAADSAGLDDVQAARLAQAVKAEALRAQQAREQARTKKRLALELAAQAGESTDAEIAEAEASGALSPVEARRMTQLAKERREREARKGDLITAVEQALAGEGPAPDTTTAEGREALDLYLNQVLMPALAEDDPAFRDAGVAWLAGRFGHVPDSVQRELLAQIQPGQPPAVRMAAVDTIAAIAEAGDGALIEAFPSDVQAFVNTVLQAQHPSDEERLAYADSKVEITSTPPSERRVEGESDEEAALTEPTVDLRTLSADRFAQSRPLNGDQRRNLDPRQSALAQSMNETDFGAAVDRMAFFPFVTNAEGDVTLGWPGALKSYWESVQVPRRLLDGEQLTQEELLAASMDLAAGGTGTNFVLTPRGALSDGIVQRGGGDTTLEKAIVNSTYEQVPGDSTGLLPDVVAGSPELRRAFTDGAEWIDASGVDAIHRDMGLNPLPTVRATGLYENAAGIVESNPASVARPQVPTRGGLISQTDLDALEAAEAVRGLIDFQEGSSFHWLVTDVPGGRTSFDVNIGRVPDQDEMKMLQEIAARHDLMIANTDRGVTLLQLDDAVTVEQAAALLWGELGDDLRVAFPDVQVTAGQLQSGYVDQSGNLALVNAGQGRGTLLMIDYLDQLRSQDGAMYERLLDSMGVQGKARDNFNRLIAFGGDGQRADYERLLSIIGESGLRGLLQYIKRFGAAGLPVVGVLAPDFATTVQDADRP